MAVQNSKSSRLKIGGTMKKIFVSTLIALALSLILVTSAAIAKAQRTALAGTEHMFFGALGSVRVSGLGSAA